MRSSETRAGTLLIAVAILSGCSVTAKFGLATPMGSNQQVTGGGGGTPAPGATAENMIPITVNGSLCSAGSYPNKPCVSVTLCTPGTTSCVTVNDILLDTGSFGLRVFKQALNGLSLTQITSGGNPLGECATFGDGAMDWGPVQMAAVTLGGEPAVNVPVQVIDATFGSTQNCSSGTGNPEASPSVAGFNGILGVGLLVQDCGAFCVGNANNGVYYSCSGTTCTQATVPLGNQVTDPVALLPSDNNGVVLELPTVPTGGIASVNGSLILGIGTQADNVPSGVTVYPVDPNAVQINTTFNGASAGSFIDSGSNGLFFGGSASLPDCGATNSMYAGWFCPTTTLSLSATNTGYNGAPTGTVQFQIGNAINLFNNANAEVYVELGGTGGQTFDWGLPFYFGKSVYHGFEGASTSLGTGPYWAY